MSGRASLRVGERAPVWVSEGGLVGRAITAALRVDAPDVSEAHALVSRRGAGLVLLGLRGELWVDDQRVRDVILAPGVTIRVGGATVLTVVEVQVERTGAAGVPATLGGVGSRVAITVRHGVVHVQQGAGPDLALPGNQGDLILQLADASAPVHWSALANYFWSERDHEKWRPRFDATIKELRAKLREHGIRDDLLASSQGSWWLDLREGEHVTR